MDRQDEALRELARRYIEADGETLLRERARLDETAHGDGDTAGLARKVAAWRRGRRRRGMLSALGGLAACVAVTLLLVRPGTQPAPPTLTPPETSQPIPLSFTLPENLSRGGFEQDREKSVYYLRDAYQDHVVMTLEYAEKVADTAGLVEVELDGHAAYARQTGQYSLLTFSKAGVVYTLTCRYDLNTLAELGRAIL